MIYPNIKRRTQMHGFMFTLLMLVLLFSSNASAFSLLLADVSSGYSGCKWTDNGNGTSTVNLTIGYKKVTPENIGASSGASFVSRGILIYTYDANGNLNPSSAAARSIYMNSELHSSYYSGIAYVMYYGSSFNGKKKWLFKTEATADVEVVLDNKYFRDWPAVSIRAGNYTSRDDVGEITGAAYVGPGTNGTCQVVDPVKPPPPPISINVTAPNWNLGELPRGDGEKSFTNSTDRLCFAYSGAAVNGRKFVINASSANGVVNNRYLLKNLTDASQTVPYSLRLSGTNTVSLPNAGNTAISFDATGTTCFVPTFKTSVDRLVKDGNYNDVLTFTVVTKS